MSASGPRLCIQESDGKEPDVGALVAAARQHPQFLGRIFDELPLPNPDFLAWTEIFDGVPVRHVKAWDVIKNREYHRIDVAVK